jgi:TrkA-C domain
VAALTSVFVIVLVSLLVTRVATVALALTGLSREAAAFQARSAFFGVGFTTSESEAVVGHPVRRRIVLALMLLGNAGIVSVVASLVISFTGNDRQPLIRLAVLVGGLVVLLLLARSRWVDRRVSRLIHVALSRWTDLDVRDYASLLELSGEYEVMELQIEAGDWLADRTLGELKLRDEGAVVLGLHRPDGSSIGAPHGDTHLRPGDTLILYGRARRLCELDTRATGRGGDEAHGAAVAEQEHWESERGWHRDERGNLDDAAAFQRTGDR